MFGHDLNTNTIDCKISMDEEALKWQFLISGVNNTLGNMYYGTSLLKDNVIYTFVGFNLLQAFFYGEFNYTDGEFVCKF